VDQGDVTSDDLVPSFDQRFEGWISLALIRQGGPTISPGVPLAQEGGGEVGPH